MDKKKHLRIAISSNIWQRHVYRSAEDGARSVSVPEPPREDIDGAGLDKGVAYPVWRLVHTLWTTNVYNVRSCMYYSLLHNGAK